MSPSPSQDYTPIVKRRWFLPVVAVLLGAGVFYKFWLQEYLEYKSSINARSIYSADSYLMYYPEGRYADEVRANVEEVWFKDFIQKVENGERYLNIDEYHDRFPNGKHLTEVKKIEEKLDLDDLEEKIRVSNPEVKVEFQEYVEAFPEPQYPERFNALKGKWWQNFRAEYGDYRRSGADSEKKYDFFQKMIDYMEESGNFRVFIRINADKVELKDFSEYSKRVRDYLDDLTTISNRLNTSSVLSQDPRYPLPSDREPLSPKSFYTQSSQKTYEQSVARGFSRSMEEEFSPGPFFLDPVNDEYDESQDVLIEFNCEIGNSEIRMEGLTIPNLYAITETSGYSTRKTFKGYILGIGVKSEVKIKWPGADEELFLSFQSDPASHLYDLSATSSSYQKVAKSSFEQLGTDLALEFGLGTDY